VRTEATGSIAMAATNDEIVVAWVEGAKERAVRVARFRASDLSLISAQGCLGPANALFVTLARSSSGYVLAAGDGKDLTIAPLDAAASPRSAPRTIPGAGGYASLVARQVGGGAVVGGPLLVSMDPAHNANPDFRLVAELLRDDGADETAPAALTGFSGGTPQISGAFTGDGFLFGVGALSQGEPAVSVARIGLEGAVSATPLAAPTPVSSPALTWSGTEAGLVYIDASGGPPKNWLYRVRLDRTGKVVDRPALVATPSGSYGTAGAVAAGGDTLVTFWSARNGSMGGPLRLDVGRISGAGATITPPFGVFAAPAIPGFAAMAAVGKDIVFAWVDAAYPLTGGATYPHLGIARVTP
jgi:hypothetical protein